MRNQTNPGRDGRFWLIAAAVCLASLAAADEPPSSARSRAAIERVRPGLEEAMRARDLRFGSPVFIRIFKQSRELEVWVEKGSVFHLFRTYGICTFSGEPGPKLETGDLQSPEGFYFVTPRQLNPNSRFHLSFNLGFPNAYDRHHGRTGSALMVHGNCVSIGCYAMTDARIEEIYALVDAAIRNGQPFVRVHIFPFRMTAGEMRRNRNSRWIRFWENLREGYEIFESRRRPPNVLVRNGVYRFQVDGE
jgi:murein L,D-transpeptidase YafK